MPLTHNASSTQNALSQDPRKRSYAHGVNGSIALQATVRKPTRRRIDQSGTSFSCTGAHAIVAYPPLTISYLSVTIRVMRVHLLTPGERQTRREMEAQSCGLFTEVAGPPKQRWNSREGLFRERREGASSFPHNVDLSRICFAAAPDLSRRQAFARLCGIDVGDYRRGNHNQGVAPYRAGTLYSFRVHGFPVAKQTERSQLHGPCHCRWLSNGPCWTW